MDSTKARSATLMTLAAAVALLAACGGGGSAGPGAAPPPPPPPPPPPSGERLYIGYYAEDPTDNPEDPTAGPLLMRLPASDGALRGQMPFAYIGCADGSDVGTIDGTRTADRFTADWTGTLDGNAVGGGFEASYDAASDRWSGEYTNAAGKQPIAVGACSYFVASRGTVRLYGSLASEPAGFVVSVPALTMPTVSWTGAGVGSYYAVRIFDYDCVAADPADAGCFRGETVTTGLSAVYPGNFANALPLTAGRRHLAIVTAQDPRSGQVRGFASQLFTAESTDALTTRGTLTLGGPDGGRFGGSFVSQVNASGSTVLEFPSGPTCNGSSPPAACSSALQFEWVENGATGTSPLETLTVVVTSAGVAPPGVAPGFGVTGISVVLGAIGIVGNFTLVCSPTQTCTDAAAAGIDFDHEARRLSFDNVTLTGLGGASVVVNGSLGY